MKSKSDCRFMYQTRLKTPQSYAAGKYCCIAKKYSGYIQTNETDEKGFGNGGTK